MSSVVCDRAERLGGQQRLAMYQAAASASGAGVEQRAAGALQASRGPSDRVAS